MITKEQRATLRHALGLTRSSSQYRNYYCATPDDPIILELVEAGLMERYTSKGDRLGLTEGYEYYRCTPAGIEAAKGADAAPA